MTYGELLYRSIVRGESGLLGSERERAGRGFPESMLRDHLRARTLGQCDPHEEHLVSRRGLAQTGEPGSSMR